MIQQSKWKWYGYPGHLCVAQWCQFHLCTEVGKFLISTVGDYRPVSERKGESFGPMKEVGCNRMFETFVFRWKNRCDIKECGCGLPKIIPSEIDTLGANTAKEATVNHYKLCLKYARE